MASTSSRSMPRPTNGLLLLKRKATHTIGSKSRRQKTLSFGRHETTLTRAFFGRFKDDAKRRKTPDPLRELKGAVNEIESREELDRYLEENGDGMTIVNIATSFCGPCKLMKPTFDLFAQNYSDALFLYVLSDKNEKTKKLSDELKVGEVPAFRFFRSGEQVWQYAGASEKILRMTIIDNLLDGEKR